MKQFISEFSLWLYGTEQGIFYKNLLTSMWIIIFYLGIIIADIIYINLGGNSDFIVLIMLFGWLMHKRLKYVIEILKEHNEFKRTSENTELPQIAG